MTSTTVTWFIVSVPVLSELIADVDPSVSTESRLFTTAPCAASSRDPLDRITCSTVGMAIGHRGQRQRDRRGEDDLRSTRRARSRGRT